MNKKKKQRPKVNSNKGFGGGSSSGTITSSALESDMLIRPKTTSNFQYAGSIRPGLQTPKRIVPSEKIKFPDYALDGQPKNRPALFPWVIETKKPEEIEKMLNEVICHGIPDDRQLQEGDIVNIDITCYLDGYHGDCSEMFVVGGEDAVDPVGKRLLQTTYDCWVKALNFVKPGNDYKDIGAIIEDHVTREGFTTVKALRPWNRKCLSHKSKYFALQKLRTSRKDGSWSHFTIEPMICENGNNYLMWPDDWTATTKDGGRSAQFEHTLLITPDGVEALTGKIETSPVQFWERDSNVHKDCGLVQHLLQKNEKEH
ncbi:methionine aminopeptidase [Skeletonema marinoi]|uniref:Methionine aminopeptidase n=1 Tax=Skeletonema marinoi TaxID=267567 RepID=A0AAD8XRM2_9STRA|nr:methionine aminopeptidase [Skeletonema marinoi]